MIWWYHIEADFIIICIFFVPNDRPHDTPFEDGTFKLTIEFTEEYPNKPPSVRFQSKMFHPNVYADGNKIRKAHFAYD